MRDFTSPRPFIQVEDVDKPPPLEGCKLCGAAYPSRGGPMLPEAPVGARQEKGDLCSVYEVMRAAAGGRQRFMAALDGIAQPALCGQNSGHGAIEQVRQLCGESVPRRQDFPCPVGAPCPCQGPGHVVAGDRGLNVVSLTAEERVRLLVPAERTQEAVLLVGDMAHRPDDKGRVGRQLRVAGRLAQVGLSVRPGPLRQPRIHVRTCQHVKRPEVEDAAGLSQAKTGVSSMQGVLPATLCGELDRQGAENPGVLRQRPHPLFRLCRHRPFVCRCVRLSILCEIQNTTTPPRCQLDVHKDTHLHIEARRCRMDPRRW